MMSYLAWNVFIFFGSTSSCSYNCSVSQFASLHAQGGLGSQPRLSFSAEVSSKTISIGETISYTLYLRYHESLKVEHPSPAKNFGDFVLRDYTITPTVYTDGFHEYSIRYDISIYRTGKASIPAASVFVMKKNGDGDGDGDEFSVKPIEIEIISLLTADQDVLEDIKTPFATAGKLAWSFYVLVSLVAFVIISAFLIYLVSRQRRKKYLLNIPYYEKAFFRLKEIQKKYAMIGGLRDANKRKRKNDTYSKEELKELYSALSRMLRVYLSEAVHDKKNQALTTRQLMDDMQNRMELNNKDTYITFLLMADKVKFSKKKYTEEAAYFFVAEFEKIVLLEKERADALAKT